MTAETKTCQNCQQAFVIEPEDFDFYTKVQVPPPTFCPDCRSQRRMAWRNERVLYHGKCAGTGKDLLTMFSPESGVKVYDREHWLSDRWDPHASGRDYDFSRPFFDQFAELMRSAPLPNLANTNAVRSDYGNHNAEVKDCYLLYASFNAENVAYTNGAVDMKNCLDVYKGIKMEWSYGDTLCGPANNLFFSYNSGPAVNGWFLNNCMEVNDCFACVNLRKRSHCIWNQPYDREAYQAERARYDTGSHRSLEEMKAKFQEFARKFPRRYADMFHSVNSTGDQVFDAKNCKNVFDMYWGAEDCKYIYHGGDMKDCYDGYGFGAKAELMYEGVDSGINGDHYRCTVFAHTCHEVDYVYACQNSSNLFGCAGLRSAKYCILNKQYSKEEYEALVPKIIAHMNEVPYTDRQGRVYRFGEFFPQEISPFAYNETIAQEYFPLTEAAAAASGYSWRQPQVRNYKITVRPEDLPDHIKDAPDSILSEVIGCAHEGKCEDQCTTAFKMISQELQFLRQFNIALPRLCPNCRHMERLRQRNPFKLWRRKCQCGGAGSRIENRELSGEIYRNTAAHFHGDTPCPNEFETSYAPQRPEIVYCEQCFQAEVA